MMFPEDGGINIEGNGYFMWQVHYDNKEHVECKTFIFKRSIDAK